MKLIPLSPSKHGQFYAQVDDEDYEWLSQWKWCVRKRGKLIEPQRRFGGRKGKSVFMHQLILGGSNRLSQIDHIDMNPLNNQRNNLRRANQSQQCMNKAARGLSTYKGVCFDKQRKKWMARISFYRKTINIGRFSTEEEAARKYDEFAKIYHGEFANLNFP